MQINQTSRTSPGYRAFAAIAIASAAALTACADTPAEPTTSDVESELRMSKIKSIFEQHDVDVSQIELADPEYAYCSEHGDCSYCEYTDWDWTSGCYRTCYGWSCYGGEDAGGDCYTDCVLWI